MNPYDSFIYYDDFSFEKNGNLRDFLGSNRPQKLLEQVQQKCILVLGGDGTMLKAIDEHHTEELPFLGINFGHKGFLLNDYRWTQGESTHYEKRLYPLLQLTQNNTPLGVAFNDINIYSPEGKVISLEVDVGFGKVGLRGDGLIVASPAGSTGHSKSYGGPVLPHKSENLVITPKGNIGVQSPKVIDDPTLIKIRNIERRFSLAINLDGVQKYVSKYDETLHLELKKSSQKVMLLIAHNHMQDWDNKVMAEQGFTS